MQIHVRTRRVHVVSIIPNHSSQIIFGQGRAEVLSVAWIVYDIFIFAAVVIRLHADTCMFLIMSNINPTVGVGTSLGSMLSHHKAVPLCPLR